MHPSRSRVSYIRPSPPHSRRGDLVTESYSNLAEDSGPPFDPRTSSDRVAGPATRNYQVKPETSIGFTR